jgi:putative transcriptional regulator
MKPLDIKPDKGKLLISEPALIDNYFKQSIVLLAEHDDEGSFGLIINKPVDVMFNEIIKQFPPFEAPVYLGGPVKTDSLFVLHTLGNKIENSLEISKGLYWGGDIDIIKELISTKQVGPDDMRFYLGFASWAPKQLDNEMNEKSWLVMNANLSHVFEHDPKHLWGKIMKSFGEDYAIWANFPGDPIMN